MVTRSALYSFVNQPSLASTFLAACSEAPFSSLARFWPEVADSSVLLMTGMPLANVLANLQLISRNLQTYRASF